MALYVGTRRVKALHVGARRVTALHVGDRTVWRPETFYATTALLYGFPTTAMGFVGGTGSTGSADAVTHETAAPLVGAGSLGVTRLWGAGTDYVTARSPERAEGSRDLRASNGDAFGLRVLVPAGTPGSSWGVRVLVVNSTGTYVWTSALASVRVGIVEQVWLQASASVLADVARVEVRVYASGVNTTASVLLDEISVGASGALYPEEPEEPGGGSDLWSTDFTQSDPKAALSLELATEDGPERLSFPTVAGVPRMRVSWPQVGSTRGYKGRSRFSDLGVPGQEECTFEYGVVVPAALKVDLTTRDLRLPSIAALPEDQPGTYTSANGVMQPDSTSVFLHLKAGGEAQSGSGTLLYDDGSGSGTWTYSNNGSNPNWYVENDGSYYTRTGGVMRWSLDDKTRFWAQSPFGGPGKRVRLTARVRTTQIGGASGGIVEGFKLWCKFPDPTNPDQGPGGCRGLTGTGFEPGSYVASQQVRDGYMEILKNNYGSYGGEYDFPQSKTLAYSVGEWEEVAIEVDWTQCTSTSGPVTVRHFRRGALQMEWTDPGNSKGPPFRKAGFFGVRGDTAAAEIDWLRIEEIGGTSTPTPAGDVWGEVSLYAAKAGGLTYPHNGDPYGLVFPLRADLVLSHEGDRSGWWEPPADQEVTVRQRVRMNTPGVADGHLDLWVDGVQLVRLRDVQWRAAGQAWLTWNQLILESWFTQGGGAAVTGHYLDVTRMELTAAGAVQQPGSPGAPVVGAVTSTSVELSWTAGQYATAHDLLRDGAVIATGIGTSHTDTGLAPETTYVYTVRAKNSAGTSDLSAATEVTTAAGTVTQDYLTPDDFSTFPNAKWEVVPTGARVAGGRGEQDYGSYLRWLTAPLDWRGKAGTLDFLNVPASGARHEYGARIDSQNNYEIVHSGTSGQLVVQRYVAGVLTELARVTAPAVPYTVRLRETGGQVVVEHRPAGGDVAYTELAREVAQVNMSAVREAITAHGSTGVTGTFLFDNNNMPGAEPDPGSEPPPPDTEEPTGAPALTGSAAGDNNVSTATVAFDGGASATAGRLLLLAASYDKDARVGTPTGWTRLAAHEGASITVYLFGKQAAGGEQSVTLTVTSFTAGTRSAALHLSEWAGYALAGVVTQVAAADGLTGVNPLAVPAVTAPSNGLALGLAGVDTASITGVTGLTWRAGVVAAGGSNNGLGVGGNAVVSGASVAPSWSQSASNDQIAAITAVFPEA